MTSNLGVIDDCSKILQMILPIDNETDEARVLQKIMDELRRDIEYILLELKAAGGSISKLENEVILAVLRHDAELTRCRRSNLKTICRVAILLSSLSSQRSTCPWPSLQ